MPEDGDVQREQVSGPGMGRQVPRPENLSSNTSQVMLCHRAPPALRQPDQRPPTPLFSLPPGTEENRKPPLLRTKNHRTYLAQVEGSPGHVWGRSG